MAAATLETHAPVTNGAAGTIEFSEPYRVLVEVEGSAPLLFHRWNDDAVAAKAEAAKGSKAKKRDDIQSYVWRTEGGELAVPGEYFRMSLVNAAKFRQDPRSPRKSAMDLFKAGIVIADELCSLGVTDWDYLDRRRVMVQRNGITRVRPAMATGWRTGFAIAVLTPEYVQPALLHEVLSLAGRLVGVGDFRPTFGRFHVTGWLVAKE